MVKELAVVNFAEALARAFGLMTLTIFLDVLSFPLPFPIVMEFLAESKNRRGLRHHKKPSLFQGKICLWEVNVKMS